jgi:hypothetical protein
MGRNDSRTSAPHGTNVTTTGNAEFEEQDGVLIVDLTEWDGTVADNPHLEVDEDRFLSLAQSNDYKGVVTDVSGVSLSAETQSYIEDSWAELISVTDIDRFAYLSEGIEAMAVTAKLDTPAEIDSFNSVSAAIDWVADTDTE